jgi:hypothetical protein
MAQFVYLGDHAETETLGFRFRAGEPTEVDSEHAIRKLRNNNHFSEVFEGVEVLMPEAPAKRKYTRRTEK